jgi:lysophospholipase L1-like esterase
MKTVLLYGDSFFWGVDGVRADRQERDDRIGVICQKLLQDRFDVVTEGLRGRTMFGENVYFPERDGLAQFGPIFASHLPIDVVVIMLGSNDLNSKTRHSPKDIADALDAYVEKMKFWCDFMKYNLPKMLVVSPPHIDESSLTVFKEIFAGSASYIDELSDKLQEKASQNGFAFLDARNIVESIDTDGIHIDAVNNKKLATAISQKILEIS